VSKRRHGVTLYSETDYRGALVEFQRAYDLHALPFTLLIGADGKVRWMGSALPPDFEARIQALLKEGPGGGHGG